MAMQLCPVFFYQSMKVSEQSILVEQSKIFLSKDSNYNFLLQISKNQKEKKKCNFTKLQQKINSIMLKMEALDANQRQEWQSTYLRKANFLYKKYSQAYENKILTELTSVELIGKQIIALRQCLYIMVYICVGSQIAYNCIRVEELIKDFYYKEYGNEIISYFQSADYDVTKFTTLLHRRAVRVPFCCCKKEEIDADVEILD